MQIFSIEENDLVLFAVRTDFNSWENVLVLSSVVGILKVETPQSVPTAPSMQRHTMRVVLVIDQFCVVRTKKFLHQKDRVKVRVGVSMLQFYTIQSYPVHLRWILGRNMG